MLVGDLLRLSSRGGRPPWGPRPRWRRGCTFIFRGKPFLAQRTFRAARADDTLGKSLGVFRGEERRLRFNGRSPAPPEKMMSAFSAMAVFTMSAKLDMATMTLTPMMPFVRFAGTFYELLLQTPDRGGTVVASNSFC